MSDSSIDIETPKKEARRIRIHGTEIRAGSPDRDAGPIRRQPTLPPPISGVPIPGVAFSRTLTTEVEPVGSSARGGGRDEDDYIRMIKFAEPGIPLSRTRTSMSGMSTASGISARISRRGSFGREEVPAELRIPPIYRTLSIQVSNSVARPEVKPPTKAAGDVASLDWHTIPEPELLARVGLASRPTGLSASSAATRLKEGGRNEITPHRPNLVKKWLEYFFGGFGSLLFIAAIVSIISWRPLGDPPQAPNLALGVILLVVICIQAGFNAYQDWSTTRVMSSIGNLLPAEALVLRDGQQTRIAAAELVVGDLIYVNLGNKIPADIRMLEVSSDLKFDRSVLTGESDAIAGTVECTDPNFMETKNVGMQGTHCVSGSGLGVVIQTGDMTVFGRIAKLSSSGGGAMTTLQKEILRFVIIIASLAVFTAAVVAILWGAWLKRDYPNYLNTSAILIDIITVAVAFIPEGLPVSVTLSLTIIANAMKRNMVLCKSLTTVETLGAVNVLCSDKTGTLTQNRMFVQNTAILDHEVHSDRAREVVVEDQPLGKAIVQLQHVAALNDAAQFDAATMTLPLLERKINGDATDTAILRFAEQLGGPGSYVADLYKSFRKVFEIPFNSRNKFMLRVFRPQGGEDPTRDVARAMSAGEAKDFDIEGGDMILFVKGAPDVLMPRCASYVHPDTAELLELDETAKERIAQLQQTWASRGQRVLLLARKVLKSKIVPQNVQPEDTEFADIIMEANTELVIVGLVGIVDPPRTEIPDVVAIMRRAGIRFFMVTGDFALTAAAIARQCGIITVENPDDLSALDAGASFDSVVKYDPDMPEEEKRMKSIVLSGKDLETMNEAQWEQLCQYDEIVFARTTPEQKLKIVKEFQARDNVVGMTGDGVNDAPSLKAADIGIAMGGGSDVAMEAADMVLLDSFASMVVAIEYGRLVFDNLKKVIIYLLPAGSFSELWAVLVTIFFGMPQAISSIQMIIISILTDCIASMSLMMEKPEADLLTRKPRNLKKDRLANSKLLGQAYGFLGLSMLVCAMSMAFRVFRKNGIPFSELWLSFGTPKVNGVEIDAQFYQDVTYEAQSTYFVTLVLMQWFNLLATRTRRLSIFQQSPILNPATSNYYLFGAMAINLCILFFFLYVPAFHHAFGTRPVQVEYWFIPLGFGMGLLIVDEIRKLLVRRFPQSFLARIAW